MRNFDQIRSAIQKFLMDASDWQSGYLAGVLITILLFILLFLLVRLLFRSGRYANGITQAAPNGDIFISSRSISDLVKSLDADLPGIIVNRVRLKRDKRKFILEISLDYQISGPTDNAREMFEKLQEKSLETLRSVFGIDSVSCIRIGIRRTRHVKSAF